MKRWMNLFFFVMGTACTITATTEDGTYFSSVENVSAATFENTRRIAISRWTSIIIGPTWPVCRIARWFMYKTDVYFHAYRYGRKILWSERR